MNNMSTHETILSTMKPYNTIWEHIAQYKSETILDIMKSYDDMGNHTAQYEPHVDI